MIKLTVNNNLVLLPADAKISIEKNSPVLNENVGSFSYPFPVSTEKNKNVLGYPGRLERAGELGIKNFILDENGIQILRGEIDFDPVTASETGLILQSGNTEFVKLMTDKKLSDLEFGGEPWFASFSTVDFQAKIDEWHSQNTNPSVSKYVCCQFQIKDSDGNPISVNEQANVSGTSRFTVPTGDYQKYYCLQFSIAWVLRKIYEAANYRIILDELSGSDFSDVCVFSKLMRVFQESYLVNGWYLEFDGSWETYGTPVLKTMIGPAFEFLNYSEIMPDNNVLDFVAAAKELLCLSIDIDERLKTVSIYFKKRIFQPEEVIVINNEISGWEHAEIVKNNGLSLAFSDQDDDLANEYDYDILRNIDTELHKPTPDVSYKDKTIHVISTNRDYKCIEDNTAYTWNEAGRLKQYQSGSGTKDEYTINVKIPPQKTVGDIDIPKIEFMLSTKDIFIDINQLAFSWFRGVCSVNSVFYPLMTFDRYSLDGAIDFTTSLKPAYLYETVYKEFINWKTYRARECTKYLKLTLIEVVQLQWRKRYAISGIPILLNQISFEVPYTGIVKINGFTA